MNPAHADKPRRAIVDQLVSIIRTHKLTYAAFNEHAKLARGKAGLKPEKTPRKLPVLLTEAQLQKVMDLTEAKSENQTGLRNTIILRMLYYTGARVAELCRFEITNVDLGRSEILLLQGKGGKDRRVVFPESFSLVLRYYIATLDKGERWLFPSKFRQHIQKRQVQNIVAAVGREVGVRLYPHLFRHQILTSLTKSGLPTEKIQLISGHASTTALAVYQHLALPDVRKGYEDAIKESGV